MIVYIYGCEGEFTGEADFQWESPKAGNAHKFMLFLAQGNDAPCINLAMQEIIKFGFSDVQINTAKPIAVEALNDTRMEAFKRHYESALKEGSSLVWYP